MYLYILLRIKIKITEEDLEVLKCSCNSLTESILPTTLKPFLCVCFYVWKCLWKLCYSVCTIIADIDLAVANHYILVYRAQRVLTRVWRDTWYSIHIASVLSAMMLQCPYLCILFFIDYERVTTWFHNCSQLVLYWSMKEYKDYPVSLQCPDKDHLVKGIS